MVITAPELVINLPDKLKVFLGGTIDNGDSIDWQKEFIEFLRIKHYDCYHNLVIFNPRRNDWLKTISNSGLSQQINWELDCLERSDIVIINLLENSKSPISLLELGLFHDKCIVICPKGFYRRANIEIVCSKYNIHLLDEFNHNSIIELLKNYITKSNIVNDK